MATYTVVAGDCLWSIAEKQLGNGLLWTNIADLNGISRSNPIIQVGQVLNLGSGGSSSGGSSTTIKKNTTSTPTIEYFGLQAGSDNTIFATWLWDKKYTENYQIRWYYDTGNDVWFVGTDSTTTVKQSTYSAPSNAKRVRFRVRPVSKKRSVGGVESVYWTASWSTEKIYDLSNNPPSTPPAPNVTLDGYTLTAKLENLDVNATKIQFQVFQDNGRLFKNGYCDIVTFYASFSCTIDPGHEYKVCCRSHRDGMHSDWSPYSSNIGTMPAAPSAITVCRANSKTSVYLEWTAVSTATTYDIEYTTEKSYFDGSNQTTTESGIEFTHYELTGLESGDEYFFRVRAVNSNGESAWSGIKSTVIGTDPAAPTTWSSTTTAIVGEELNLYWVHNAEDGSKQTYAELELIVDGATEVHTIETPVDDEEDEDENKTNVYPIDTTEYTEGSKIQWRVRTAGVTKAYGDWSIQRTIDIYAPPTLSLNVTDIDGNVLEQLNSFPFYISALAGPNTQVPIGYHLVITANDRYETVDDVGNTKIVNKGEAVYSKYFDITTELVVEFSANNIDLENNIGYTVTCAVTMNSGLTTESSSTFTVGWTDIEYEPNAEISIDTDSLSAHIRPYCEDENGETIEGIYLSVYRRELDGSFTEIVKNVENSVSSFVTDPHPSLDYARYRIVATTKETGAVSYYDVPGFPVGEKAAVLQWSEEWTGFDTTNEDALAEPTWSGSMLKLPYNVDVSDNYGTDVSLIEYIGRKHPVSYYGTQLGHTSTWNMAIPKYDTDTLNTLRRLARWTGDVYVREPSGSGYWANVSVSFGQKHLEVTIPITFDITRVEGGV